MPKGKVCLVVVFHLVFAARAGAPFCALPRIQSLSVLEERVAVSPSPVVRWRCAPPPCPRVHERARTIPPAGAVGRALLEQSGFVRAVSR